MRVIDTFTVVLIAGILCSGITLCSSLLQDIAKLNNLDGSRNSTATEKEIHKLLMESCAKNGGPKAYDTVNKGWRNFMRCAERSEEQLKKMHIIAGDIFINVKKYCTMIKIEENCFKEFKNTLEPCLEPEEHDSVQMIYNIIISSLDFLCDMDGARITKFIDDDGVACVRSKNQALLSCTKDFSNHYTSSSAINSGSATEVLSLLPVVEDCINMDKFQQCSVKLLNECKHHTPAEIADALFISIKREMDCTKLHNSQVSVSSSINVVLLTIAMAIVVHFA